MLSAMPPRARVIVSAYNQLPALRLALRGYLRQTSAAFGLTVADDGSREDTRAFLVEFAEEATAHGLHFEHVWQEDDGFRKARIMNEAVRRTKGEEVLVFSDGDCIPPAHFVEHHLNAFEPWSFHVGGAYRLSKDVSAKIAADDVDTGWFETLGGPEHEKALRRLRRKSFWGTLFRRRNRPKLYGLNFAMDRDLFVAINGYDERFTKYGLEDTDLGDRAMRVKPRPRVKNLYTACDVYHLWHPSTPGGRSGGLEIYENITHPPRCVHGLEPPVSA